MTTNIYLHSLFVPLFLTYLIPYNRNLMNIFTAVFDIKPTIIQIYHTLFLTPSLNNTNQSLKKNIGHFTAAKISKDFFVVWYMAQYTKDN